MEDERWICLTFSGGRDYWMITIYLSCWLLGTYTIEQTNAWTGGNMSLWQAGMLDAIVSLGRLLFLPHIVSFHCCSLQTTLIASNAFMCGNEYRLDETADHERKVKRSMMRGRYVDWGFLFVRSPSPPFLYLFISSLFLSMYLFTSSVYSSPWSPSFAIFPFFLFQILPFFFLSLSLSFSLFPSIHAMPNGTKSSACCICVWNHLFRQAWIDHGKPLFGYPLPLVSSYAFRYLM